MLVAFPHNFVEFGISAKESDVALLEKFKWEEPAVTGNQLSWFQSWTKDGLLMSALVERIGLKNNLSDKPLFEVFHGDSQLSHDITSGDRRDSRSNVYAFPISGRKQTGKKPQSAGRICR